MIARSLFDETLARSCYWQDHCVQIVFR